MKTITAIAVLLLFHLGLHAQFYEYNIQYFGNMEGNASTIISDVLDWGEEPQYITLVPKFNKFETHLVRKEDDQVVRNKLGAPLKNCYDFETLVRDGRYFKLFLNRNKKDKKVYRILAEFNQDAKYVDVKSIDTLAYTKKDNFPEQDLFMSADSSFYLTVDVIDKNKKGDFYTTCKVYDSRFNEIRKFQFARKGKNGQKGTQFLTAGINDKGDVYLVHRLYNEKNDWFKKVNGEKVPAYKIEVIENQMSGEQNSYSIENEDKFMSSMKLFFNTENQPILVGQLLGGDAWYDSYVNGLSIHTFEKNKFNSAIHIFDKKQIEDFGNWGGKKKQGIKPGSKFGSTYMVKDDRIFFQIENITTEYETDAMGKTLKSISRSSVVFTISTDGTIQDYMHFPKYSQNYYFEIESILFLIGNRPALLYYDKVDNLEKDLSDYKNFKEFSGAFGGHKKTRLILGYKNENGDVVRDDFKETEKMFSNLKNFSYDQSKGELKLIMMSDLSVFKKPDVNIFTLSEL